jgi:hypothetical protein
MRIIALTANGYLDILSKTITRPLDDRFPVRLATQVARRRKGTT